MANFRVSHAAQADIISILAWSNEQFGEEARRRYEALIAAAIRWLFLRYLYRNNTFLRV